MSFRTAHHCDSKDHGTLFLEVSNATQKGVESKIRSAGFNAGTRDCRPSQWAVDNKVQHGLLKDIDVSIEVNAQHTLRVTFAEFKIVHRDGLRGEPRLSLIL